jgi:hypothetical protein
VIRRDFMKMVSIATAGLAFFRFVRPEPAVAKLNSKPRRQWLSGSTRSGCAHLPGADLIPQ